MTETNTDHPWHTYSEPLLLQWLQVNPEQGLSNQEVSHRLSKYGHNEILDHRQRSLWKIILDQFRDFMILVLLVAAIASGLIGDPIDTLAILVIVLLNAAIGSVQEYRAEHAIAALRAMAQTEIHVTRQGKRKVVSSSDLVPGDVVWLEAGNIVPADIRLIDSNNLECNEAALTGESVAVEKQAQPIAEESLSLNQKLNLVFKGTQITRGRATGLVVQTGMQTELGNIASLLSLTSDSQTPLQKRLTQFGQRLAIIILFVCAVIFALGFLQGEPALIMLLTAISLAVAAIPEALPAVVSISLAFGARKMSKRQALIQHLPAVETLGSVTYICTDKTGTLTQNKMQVDSLLINSNSYNKIPEQKAEFWQRVGQGLAISNDVIDDQDQAIGEPTELALFQIAETAGFKKSVLQKEMPRIAEIAFSSERKLMTTIHREQQTGSIVIFTKGAPENLLPLCSKRLLPDGSEAPIDSQALLQQSEQMAASGYRMLALAFQTADQLSDDPQENEVEHDLTFLCLLSLIDPPRAEALDAVSECKQAGITPVMITGDHPSTALAIASKVGICSEQDNVITGQQLDEINDQELLKVVKNTRVYARVSPEQKIRIVQALKRGGEFCAMTGDGVNDAPALKSADIGVAMGKKGTDVAREAADMVLLDDNFATIVSAVREGRRIFDNIRKFIKYTMATNTGEILTLLMAPFFGLPIPLLPLHILWINLVTDGLPGLALATEKAEPGIMKRPPRSPDENIFSQGLWQHIVWVGAFIGAITLATQAWAIRFSPEHWQTMVFTVLTFSQLAQVLSVRSETQGVWTLGFFSNRPLILSILLTILLQMLVIYLPILNVIFHTTPLPFSELLICFALPSLVFIALEIQKLVKIKKQA